MTRKKNAALLPVASTHRNEVRRMNGGTGLVAVDVVYRVPSVHPFQEGPWALEADKIAWTDPMSGLACIIRRSGLTGCLEGYVGVGPEHPLFEVTPGALVGLGLQAHGGINYAQPCAKTEDESVSVCHVARPAEVLHSHRPASVDGVDHDDAWWFGFTCDHASDVIPSSSPSGRTKLPNGINLPVYRDEAFVHRGCAHLAAQLQALADGRDPSEVVPEQVTVPYYDPRRIEG